MYCGTHVEGKYLSRYTYDNISIFYYVVKLVPNLEVLFYSNECTAKNDTMYLHIMLIHDS